MPKSVKKSATKMPKVISGSELYDSIMSQIEPELTSKNYHMIAEFTIDETVEDRTKRAERYIKAFDEYDRRFSEQEAKWRDQFMKFRKASMVELEAESTDKNLISSLESAISSS